MSRSELSLSRDNPEFFDNTADLFVVRTDFRFKEDWEGLVEARVIDLDGVYNPCRPNDRLLLGMKGSISEFELGILRTRMLDAARAKARRGELRISVPIGYIWHREIGLGFDPDLRVQEAIRVIFSRFRQRVSPADAARLAHSRPGDQTAADS